MSDLTGIADDYANRHVLSEDVDFAEHKTAFSKESEEQASDEQEHEMDDLFGHDHGKFTSAIRASPPTSGAESERLPSPDRVRRHALEYEEDDLPPEIAVEVKEAQVNFPNLPVPKSSDGNSWVIRMPNFVSVDTKPFHPETYMGPEQEDEEFQGENIREKSMSIKLKVENTLRWRWTKEDNGQDKRESNARIVRWSDGTLSLRLGKEFFDITQSIDSSGRVSRSTLGGSQLSSQSSQITSVAGPGNRSEGLTYLVAQHKRSQILQAEALITGYMSLRPTGMQSETHRLLVKAVGQRHNKVARLRIAPEPTVDPEREKIELMKQSAKKSRSKRATQDEYGYTKRRKRMPRSMDRDIYTDDEEEPGMYAGDEDYGVDHPIGSSPRKSKRKPGEDMAEDYQADDFVVPDESDEDMEGGRGKKRTRAISAEKDDLERMEAKLEKQAATERKTREGDGKKSKKLNVEDEETEGEDAAAMDVESEEEEEESKVRRVTSKRAMNFDEEDE